MSFKIIALIFFSLIFFITVKAQDINVKGLIIDSVSNNPLIGVTISVKNRQVVSDVNGKFNLKTQIDTFKKYGLNLSLLGYQTKHVKFLNNLFFSLKLKPATILLKDVNIYASGADIVEKAIRNIPINYPNRDFIMNGILRIYHIDKDTIQGVFYKNDAVLKIFHPSYFDKNKSPQVALLQNKPILFMTNKKSNTFSWFNGYMIPNKDFIYRNEDFVNLNAMGKYNFYIREKVNVGRNSVYVVDFTPKGKRGYYGILKIDSASLAFIHASYSRNYTTSIFPTSKLKNTRVVDFKKEKDKWFLHKIVSYNTYNDSNLSYNTIYQTISIDTLNPQTLNPKEIIPPFSEDIKFNKILGDSAWVSYKELFKNLEIKEINPTSHQTIETTKGFVNKQTFANGLIGYLLNDNIRLIISLNTLPFSVDRNQSILAKRISPVKLNMIGASIRIRIFDQLFIEGGGANNYGLGGLFSKSRSYGILYNFKVKDEFFLFTPFIGYSNFSLGKGTHHYIKRNDLLFGGEISHKISSNLNVFVHANYLNNLNSYNEGLTITKHLFQYSLGTIFRIR